MAAVIFSDFGVQENKACHCFPIYLPWSDVRNSNNLRYADDTTLTAESEEELKSPMMKVKEESEKVGLKLNIWKTKIMASSPITSWQIDGETVETVADFIFLGGQMVIATMKLKDAYSLEGKLWPTQIAN